MKPLIKPAVLFLMFLFLMIPLGMVEEVVHERSMYRDTAVRDIAASWTGAQVLEGPFLVVDYQITKTRKYWDEKLEEYVSTDYQVDRRALIRPSNSLVDADLNVSFRHRGIYEVPVYSTRFEVRAGFDPEAITTAFKQEESPVIKKVTLEVGVSDARGFSGSPLLHWDETEIDSVPGVTYQVGKQGFHSDITRYFSQVGENQLSFQGEFSLRGINSLSVRPAGADARIEMTSNWPHPSFQGQFLPDSRQINDEGFVSSWNISSLASGNRVVPERIQSGSQFKSHDNALSVGVKLFQPVDIYTLGDRATKYGALFILVTFTFFYLLEMLKSKKLHPIQYSLVGMALAIFFLLLLSFSEHIGFGFAYLIASIACIGMIMLYTRSVMSKSLALLIGTVLSVMYLSCYVILQLEGHALLVGSLLLFLLLGVVMFFTRTIDWEKVSTGMGKFRKRAVVNQQPFPE